jgi:putative colanic acid biosynthesis glycosyltransferase WcaI
VVVISQIYPPDLAGSATRALNVAKGLSAGNVGVTVVAAFPHYPNGLIPKKYRLRPFVVESHNGIRLIRTFVPPLQSKGFGRRLLLFGAFMVSSLFAIPFVRKADAVFASNPQTLVAFPGRVYAWILGCPLILNADDLWPESLYDLGMLKSKMGQTVGDLVARIAYSLADLVTPISSGYVETLVGKYRLDPQKVNVIAGGVDLKMFTRKRLVDKKTFDVLYIGAFSIAYDFDQVLYAARALADYPDVRFAFQGSGELASHIKSVVNSLKLVNVIVSDNVVSREEAANIMVESDALILPLSGTGNIEKGFSSKIYEYQAAGKPIICCSRGVVAKYILSTRSGIVVEPGDASGIRDAILRLKSNSEIASAMGEAGRSVVEKSFSISRVGSDLVQLIGKCRNT